MSLNILYCYNLINCHSVASLQTDLIILRIDSMSNNTVCRQATLLPTVLGVMLFSIQSVLLSVESISVVRQSLYMYQTIYTEKLHEMEN